LEEWKCITNGTGEIIPTWIYNKEWKDSGKLTLMFVIRNIFLGKFGIELTR